MACQASVGGGMSANQSASEVLRLLELKDKLEKRVKREPTIPIPVHCVVPFTPNTQQFFEMGATRRERAFIAANKIGKSEGVGAYETVLHLTGQYPAWWKGRKWNRPIAAWASGDTAKTTRDIIQRILLGPFGEFGTGMIPADCIVRTTTKQGIGDAIEGIFVKHVSGGTSELILKSYDQKREAFQGTNRDLVWL